MLKFSASTVVTSMKETGMVPVFYHADLDTAKGVVDAAYAGGVRVFEFTNRGGNAYDVFTKLLTHAAQYSDLIMGIGTIMDAEATKKFIDAGAHFIVSPIMKPDMAVVCKAHDIMWTPGCATLTEIVAGRDHGAEVIKIFPGSVLGPGFVSSIMPVVPGLQLMPTGGVEPNEKNLRGWFNAGVMCVGMGSQLFTRDIIAEKNWPSLKEKVSETLRVIRQIRM